MHQDAMGGTWECPKNHQEAPGNAPCIRKHPGTHQSNQKEIPAPFL